MSRRTVKLSSVFSNHCGLLHSTLLTVLGLDVTVQDAHASVKWSMAEVQRAHELGNHPLFQRSALCEESREV
jgi:hypothetical protein